MNITYRWKDDDTIVAENEEGKELLCIKLSNIPNVKQGLEYWIDENDRNRIHLYNGIDTAAIVSRTELLHNLEEFFDGDVICRFTEAALWKYVIIENFTAWYDTSYFLL